MATPRELLQSILTQLTVAQNASEELLATEGVAEILSDMDDLAVELGDVLG